MDEQSKMDKLNESLNSRTQYRDPGNSRSSIEELDTPPVRQDFNSSKLDDMIKQDRRRAENHPVMKKLFTFALVFFVAATALAGYIYLGGSNLISSKNVDISVLGPVTVSAGEPLELGVTISNKNNADLTVVNMVISYPDGSRSAEDTTKPLSRSKLALGQIVAGGSVTKTERAVLYGQKGDVKTLTISLDYKVKGSNAIFTKDKTYEISIGSAPVTMTVTEPPTIASGDPFTTTLTLLANSSEILKNVVVRAEYPYGFSVVESKPAPATADNVWMIGDLAPGATKTITIKGSLSGENLEERTFRFYTGVSSNNETFAFDAPLATLSQTVGISRSALALKMSLNGDSNATYAAPSGKQIQATVQFKNNLPSSILNGRIQVKLGGVALDRSSISPQNGGFYDSANNMIIWDGTNDSNLSTLAPGDDGQVGFTFSSLSNLPPGTKNSEINLSTSFTATPQNTDSTANLSATTVNSVKVASEVALTGRVLYSRGPFKNTGPIPPQVEKKTTYTLVIDLGNTQNDVSNSKVVGTLGPNVEWVGATSPTTESIIFDPTTKQIVWSAGTLPSGAGFSSAGKEVSFQVSLSPSLGQVRSVPILLQNITFSGSDAFTSSPINLTMPAMTTRISSDPSYVQGDEMVVK